MALTLARVEGTPGLSLFYVELRDAMGALRGIRVLRLKEKLGTKALPTAELTLDGTPARLVGENVAHAASVRLAHRALYESPSHRENLLRSEFDRVGAAVLDDTDGSVWVAEVFAAEAR